MVQRRRMRSSPEIPNLIDALLLAAARVGEDGAGKDGLIGYMAFVARKYPKSFLKLLGQIPLNEPIEEPAKVEFRTIEEVQEDLRRRGIVLDDSVFG